MPTSHNTLLQTAAPQVPVKPSYVEFAKRTPSARFLKFCKVGTRENSCKKKARKNTLTRMSSCRRYNFRKVPTSHNILAANRGSPSAPGAELCRICQGDPQRAFSEILQSWNQGKLLQKEGQKKPWRECHHVLARISLKCQPGTTCCCKSRLPKCPWS